MKLISLFSLLILQFAYSYSFCQEKDSAGIYVAGAPFYMTTWARITCEKFGSSHAPWMKYRHILNQDTLVLLDTFLKKIKYQRKNNEIDVRAKMVYVRSKGRTSICMNLNDIMINGRLIERNEPFVDFLISLSPYNNL